MSYWISPATILIYQSNTVVRDYRWWIISDVPLNEKHITFNKFHKVVTNSWTIGKWKYHTVNRQCSQPHWTLLPSNSFLVFSTGVWILNIWGDVLWTPPGVLSVDPWHFIVVNLIISSSLVHDPRTCFCLWLILPAAAAMMDLVKLHRWSSLIIGML